MSENRNTDVWDSGKRSVEDLEKGDIIYVRKMSSGYTFYLECKFEEYTKGIIYSKCINVHPPWGKISYINNDVRSRRKTTYLWGRTSDNHGSRKVCKWLNDKHD